MSVKIRIPAPLRQFTNGAEVVESQTSNIGDLLTELKTKAPGIEQRLFKGATGQLNRFVNIYVNQEDIRFLQNLDGLPLRRRRFGQRDRDQVRRASGSLHLSDEHRGPVARIAERRLGFSP